MWHQWVQKGGVMCSEHVPGGPEESLDRLSQMKGLIGLQCGGGRISGTVTGSVSLAPW